MKANTLILILTCIFCSCVDPYNIKLKNFETILVVDALLTDDNSSCYVKLSRTNQFQDLEPEIVTGAIVRIIDENGNSSVLQETENGTYKNDSTAITGTIGTTYTLSVITPDGKEYESEPCLMYPVNNIENVYFEKDLEILNNGQEIKDGIRVFVDSDNNSDSRYLRWMYNETWKIMVPDPKKFNYINDSTILEVDQIKQTCWGTKTSDEIIIHSGGAGLTGEIEKKPILFIDPLTSGRFLIKYSIEIKQLSLSQKEYEFWEQLMQINESGGSIFDKQPYPVLSNLHNVDDPDEPVLGYFQVSAVSKRRIFITPNEISALGLETYGYDCRRVIKGPDDYPPPLSPGAEITFDKIYRMYVGPSYSFIEPVYDAQGKLIKLVFSGNVCSDCTLTGNLERPDFWID